MSNTSPHGKIAATVAPDGSLTIDAQPHEGLAKAMPWTLSLMLHAGIAMILAMATMIPTMPTPTGEEEMVANFIPGPVDIESHAANFLPPPKGDNMESTNFQALQHDERTAVHDKIASNFDKPGKPSRLITTGGIVTNLGSTFSRSQVYGTHDGTGPRVDGPVGMTARAYHIVFVMDRSGSMLDGFDQVRNELLHTIAKLQPDQDFHVIFFSDGKPVENPPHQLVHAEYEYKQQAAKFLDNVQAAGQTDPLPAIGRAFDVLAGQKGGKVIFLLTDGAFPDNQKVLDLINKRNADKGVTIITYLFGDRSKDATANLKRIATENNGKFKAISQDE